MNEVYFWYEGGIPFPEILATSSLAKYRVEGGRAIRVAPLALTIAGFIDEWLNVPTPEIAEWSLPAAATAHAAMAARLKKDGFDLDSLAACPDQTLEVVVTAHEKKEHLVFKIVGTRAKDLRMASISRAPNPACKAIPEPQAHQWVFAELP